MSLIEESREPEPQPRRSRKPDGTKTRNRQARWSPIPRPRVFVLPRIRDRRPFLTRLRSPGLGEPVADDEGEARQDVAAVERSVFMEQLRLLGRRRRAQVRCYPLPKS